MPDPDDRVTSTLAETQDPAVIAADFLADVRMQADDHHLVPAGMVYPLLAGIEAALELHKPVDRGRVMPCCEGCEEADGNAHGCREWPCPTVRAITAGNPRG